MPLTSLWLPILLSAVLVFVASSLIHMLLGYHKNDLTKLSKEEEVMDALRPFEIPPGDYFFPRPSDPKEMKDPAFIEKQKKGPIAVMTVVENGPPSMGKPLALWFVYCVVVSFIAAYIASRAVGPGAPYRAAFRFAGATAFVGYSLALWQNTIWYKRAWTTTLKSNIDGLIYGLLTGGVFGWLWPR